VIDGDTVVINKVRVRLAGIDAPELDHPWGQRSKWALVQLCKGQTVTARIKPELSYDRCVAECFLPDGRDLAAELVRMALLWIGPSSPAANTATLSLLMREAGFGVPRRASAAGFAQTMANPCRSSAPRLSSGCGSALSRVSDWRIRRESGHHVVCAMSL
jgi:hypothetical protein